MVQETDRAVRLAVVALLPIAPGPVRWLLFRIAVGLLHACAS